MTILENLTLAPMKLQGKKRGNWGWGNETSWTRRRKTGLRPIRTSFPAGRSKAYCDSQGAFVWKPMWCCFDEPDIGSDPETSGEVLLSAWFGGGKDDNGGRYPWDGDLRGGSDCRNVWRIGGKLSREAKMNRMSFSGIQKSEKITGVFKQGAVKRSIYLCYRQNGTVQ